MAEQKKWPGWLSGEQARAENMIRLEHLNRVADELRREIMRSGANDTGRLADSIRVNIVKGEVVMVAPYSRFVEEGVRPGGKVPPYKKIRKWVGHKLGLSGKQGKNVAWAVMWKIHKRGIPARHLIERAWRRALR